ncbi:cation diffusion facilitator family transporter [Lederbergia wuyishanensis]|uniref:Cation diffusion facilitator family transporter n=1 Tax=Lederbergia wuyishanensis TaxID=1347903 RepID=A0ABU0D1Q5_9BACI|nr:cation diffusion facilitator family transporter [Lederbergia wuyishanensis]MCJ8006942.1 cation diffusion facilitator family transporter [Lederbergia wuyishanensis]MDQ0342326.1 cation diffusion facilitator family transporter [Lederbergia wuyishanensis]
MKQDDRFKQAEFAAWLGIIVNIILTIVKGIIGMKSNSKALIADAVHSASDIAGSLAVYIGLRAAKRPPDEDHPYGHGKAESIAAIIVAVILFLAGLQIGKTSITSLFTKIEVPGAMAIYAVIFSIIVKEALFQYKYRLGKKLNSDALIVNAYEHRSDVYSSIAALIGIGASILGNKINVHWLEYGDPIAGVTVSLLVLKMAWKLGADSIHNTLDHVLHEEDTTTFREMVASVPEVKEIGELHAREHGYYVIIDLKISVDPDITVKEGHEIGKKVKSKLLDHPDVHDVFVHINPDHSDENK